MAIKRLTGTSLKSITKVRKGEVKLGEAVHTLKSSDLSGLGDFKKKGVRFCLLGIPECIGVLGNMGIPGAENGWSAFLSAFLNIQSNRFLTGNEFLVLGEIDTSDLQAKAMEADSDSEYYLQKMHVLCESLDERVWPVIEEISKSGLIPIVIGGGHNNAYPILKGASLGLSEKNGINAINLDAHADYRSLEGRHSGNGFSYAQQRGFLNRYYAFGLHQSYNSEHMLKVMDGTETVSYNFMEDLVYLDEALAKALEFVKGETVCGIELDLDAIKLMPSSAMAPTGFSLEQARHYVKKCARALKTAYLHLPEGAPKNDIENRMVGKSLSYLVADFAKASKK